MPFQFAYDLSLNSNYVPLAVPWPMAGTAGYNVGDLLVIDGSGNMGTVTTGVGTVSAVNAAYRASGTAGQIGTVYIVRPNQVWRCSMNGTSTSNVAGARTLTVTNAGTLSTATSGGSIALYSKADLDAAGNVSALVTFPFTTW